MWRWFHGGWHRSAGRGQREGYLKKEVERGEEGSGLKKKSYSYTGTPQASNCCEDMNSHSFSAYSLHPSIFSIHPSLWVSGPFTVRSWGDQSGPCPLSLCFHSLSIFHPIFSFCSGVGGGGANKTVILPLNSSFINQTSAVCQGEEWRTWVCEFKTCSVNTHSNTHTHTHKNMQLTTDKCLGVFHISSAAKQTITKKHQSSFCVWVCVKERDGERRKKKLVRQMTWKHRTTTSLLSFIKPPSLSSLFSISLKHTSVHTQAHTHKLTGRADILGGVIPGVESLRSPCCDPVILGRGSVLDACRERKRLYIKNTFLPEAVSLQTHGYEPSTYCI